MLHSVEVPARRLIEAFLFRRVRAVGPLVLSFLIALAFGSEAVLSMAENSSVFLYAFSRIASALGFNAKLTFISMIALGMVLFGWLVGWPILRLLGKGYDRKKFSDQSITLDALWLLFAVIQSVELAFQGAPWVLSGLVAFAGFKLVSALGFQRALLNADASGSKALLLLRAFALGKRSEKFFDKLRRHWQYAGSILMIAGPDLVTTTVEPHEFLDFLRGRVGRQFVSSAQDLQRRLAVVDNAPDPDGRYRVNEFFCHNDTWQVAMEELAASAGAVLMDLRSFSAANRGCIFELSRLLDGIDLNRVVFLVDETTDRTFLEATIQSLWQNLRADSPNQDATAPSAHLFSVSSQDERELLLLVGLLMGGAPIAASAQPPLVPA